MKRCLANFSIAISVLVSVCSCGRVGPPVPPEVLAPEQVQALKVTGSQEGVNFYWEAPASDQRGEELKSIEGYRVYRKKVTRSADILDKEIEFELLSDLPDTHLVELEKEREKLRLINRPAHRARVDSKLTQFTYTDKGVSSGSTYVYKVVGTNQGGLESDSFQLVKVLWRGDSSEITVVDTSTLSVEDDFLGSDEE